MTPEERADMLQAAIIHHRMAVGQAYGIGSFKTHHAANLELWSHVKEHLIRKPDEDQ